MTADNKTLLHTPLGCFEDEFILDVLNLYTQEDLTIDELAFYFNMSIEEVNYIIDMHLKIFLATGGLRYKFKEE